MVNPYLWRIRTHSKQFSIKRGNKLSKRIKWLGKGALTIESWRPRFEWKAKKEIRESSFIEMNHIWKLFKSQLVFNLYYFLLGAGRALGALSGFCVRVVSRADPRISNLTTPSSISPPPPLTATTRLFLPHHFSLSLLVDTPPLITTPLLATFIWSRCLLMSDNEW